MRIIGVIRKGDFVEMRSSRCKCGKWADGVGMKLCWECRRKKYGDRITNYKRLAYAKEAVSDELTNKVGDRPRIPTPEELEKLRQAGYRITVLSNGDLLISV